MSLGGCGGGEGGSIGRRFSIGSGGGFNVNWDSVWDVKTERGEYGWSAEFAIPFKTLRYKKDKKQRVVVGWTKHIYTVSYTHLTLPTKA